MAYLYEDLKPTLFTERGQEKFLKVRDKTKSLLSLAGACRLEEMISGAFGDSWELLACVDRLVELGEIREITGSGVAGQHRVFVKAYGR